MYHLPVPGIGKILVSDTIPSVDNSVSMKDHQLLSNIGSEVSEVLIHSL